MNADVVKILKVFRDYVDKYFAYQDIIFIFN